jgi:hypothetical protein
MPKSIQYALARKNAIGEHKLTPNAIDRLTHKQ